MIPALMLTAALVAVSVLFEPGTTRDWTLVIGSLLAIALCCRAVVKAAK